MKISDLSLVYNLLLSTDGIIIVESQPSQANSSYYVYLSATNLNICQKSRSA